MKKENAGLLFLRTFFAIVFSILLVVLLVVIPVFRTATVITKPKKIAAMAGEVIKSINLTELIELPETIEIGEHALDAEATKALLESDVVKNILGTCTQQMLEVYTSEDPTAVFNEEDIQVILDDNTDELTALLQEHVPETAKLPVEDMKQQLAANLNEISQQVMEHFPSKEEVQLLLNGDLSGTISDKVNDKLNDELEDKLNDKLGNNAGEVVDDALNNAQGVIDNAQDTLDDLRGTAADVEKVMETLTTVHKILSNRTAFMLYGATALLALLVLLCRYKNLNGLIWLGVDAMLAGIPLLLGCLVLGSGSLVLSLMPEVPVAKTLVTSVLTILLGEVQLGAIVLAVAGVVLIVAGAVYKGVRKKAAK